MDAAPPLVSVIMSVHNGEQWLAEAIESIICQTYTNWEMIIIDDASAPPAQTILQHYHLDERITVIRQSRQQGLTKNLNIAIDHCKGEFIARMDADDISVHDRLEKQVNFLVNNPGTVVVAGFVEMMNESGIPAGVWADDRKAITEKKIRSMLPWKSCLAHPSVMFRAGELRKYRYTETQVHSQDWDLWLRLAADGKIISKIPVTLLLYRVHDKSVTQTTNRSSAFFKKHQAYRRYLAHAPFNAFNLKVRIAFLFNAIKLFLSRIKRKFVS